MSSYHISRRCHLSNTVVNATLQAAVNACKGMIFPQKIPPKPAAIILRFCQPPRLKQKIPYGGVHIPCLCFLVIKRDICRAACETIALLSRLSTRPNLVAGPAFCQPQATNQSLIFSPAAAGERSMPHPTDHKICKERIL